MVISHAKSPPKGPPTSCKEPPKRPPTSRKEPPKRPPTSRKEAPLCRELFFSGDPFPAGLEYPVVFVHICIPEERIVGIHVHHSRLRIIQPIPTVVPPQGDLGGRDVVSQLGAAYIGGGGHEWGNGMRERMWG